MRVRVGPNYRARTIFREGEMATKTKDGCTPKMACLNSRSEASREFAFQRSLSTANALVSGCCVERNHLSTTVHIEPLPQTLYSN